MERVRLDHGVVIPVLEPLRRVNQSLLELLGGFAEPDWSRPTVHPARDVKDLATHLLHGSLRRVTGLRDRYRRAGPAIRSAEELVAAIQRENREFMTGMRGVSPAILVELIRRYDPELVALFEALDPHATGLGVVWAGEWSSPNWLDVAREYTEKWHHQQQIRDATERPPLYEPELLEPVLQTFARGLPFAFRRLDAPEGSRLCVELTGASRSGWTLVREAERWSLWSGPDAEAPTRISMPAEVAWRVWTKSLDPG